MNFNWKKYRKLIPAMVGITLLIVLNRWDIKIPGLDMIIVDWLVGAATVFGIRQATNEQ